MCLRKFENRANAHVRKIAECVISLAETGELKFFLIFFKMVKECDEVEILLNYVVVVAISAVYI